MKQLKNQPKCALGRVMRGHVPFLGRSIFSSVIQQHKESKSGYRQGESGRSMVEMLGVLAIIGVLSVGGIAGYTTAMNKHRANKILNGASVRAIVVSTQIQRGSNAPTLGEFTDNEIGGARFGTGVQNAEGTAAWATTDKRFSLTLTGVNEDICTQMKASVGQNSIIREIDDNCTTITYNNDLSPNDPEPSYDDNAGAKDCSSNADCDAGCQTCTNGKCISKCDLGEYCGKSSSSSDYTCVGVPTCTTNDECSTGCCSNGVCVPSVSEETCHSPGTWRPGPPNGEYNCFDDDNNVVGACPPETSKGCRSNSQCDEGEYCAIATDSCSSITTGTCAPLGTVHTVSGKTGSAATYNGMTYSGGYMTLWSAINWCKAQGKRLVSLSDLGITGGYNNEGGSCYGSDCTGANWNGFIVAFGINSYWTNDSYNSCLVFTVRGNQYVYRVNRNNGFYALCR